MSKSKPLLSCERLHTILSFAFFTKILLESLFTLRLCNVQTLSNLNSTRTVAELGSNESECFKTNACNSLSAITNAKSSRLGIEAWLGQLLRLLKSGEKKCIGHVWFWIGQCLSDLLPDWQITNHASKPATYFVSLAELVADAQIQNVLPASGWRTLSNKVIYSKYVESFEDVKVELNASVWKILNSLCLDHQTHEVMYLLLHNKLATRERLFRVYMANDPYCITCMEAGIPEVCEREHLFCSCLALANVWSEVRRMLNNIQQSIISTSNLELITLTFPKGGFSKEIAWIVATYVTEIWRIHCRSSSFPNRDQMFGFLRFKFKLDQIGARVKLNEIPGL